MLLRSQRCASHGFSSVLNHYPLNSGSAENYSKEEPVGEDGVEDVELRGSHLSAVELVEEMQVDEGVEHNGVGGTFVSGYSIIVKELVTVLVGKTPHVVCEEELNSHHDGDIDGHSVDLFPHSRGHYWFLFLNGWVFND